MSDWNAEEQAIMALAAATVREGGHVEFLATLLVQGPLCTRTRAEIIAALGSPQRTPVAVSGSVAPRHGG